jgi:hypothetical protein
VARQPTRSQMVLEGMGLELNSDLKKIMEERSFPV